MVNHMRGAAPRSFTIVQQHQKNSCEKNGTNNMSLFVRLKIAFFFLS